MLKFNSLIIFSENPAHLTDFYSQVFDRKPDWSGGEFSGFSVGDGFITIGPHDKVHGRSVQPERLMFNLETNDVDAEFERISKLDVTVIAKPYSPGEMDEGKIATLADPDGNYFQLVTPMSPNNL